MSATAIGHASDDRLIELAADLLDARARDAILDHLRCCPACERRFLDVWSQSERLAVRGAPRAGARAVGERRPASRRWLAGAAAAILLVALAAYALFPWRAEPDGLDYWLPIDAERLLLRSTAQTGDDERRFTEALEAYERRDLDRVIGLLDGRPIPRAFEPMGLFLASALVGRQRHDEARELLGRLQIHTLPQPARDRALWILYVALRRGGRPQEADGVARLLAASAGELSERAAAQLRR